MQNNNSMNQSGISNNSASQPAGAMNDRMAAETLLNQTKGMCNLFMNGAIESSTPQVHAAFEQALKDSICMQQEIYQKMSEKGWYPAQQAQQNEVSQTKQKYQSQSSGQSM